MEPEEYDVVRLRRALPEFNLPAGAEGMALIKHKAEGLPLAYEVEFPASVGATEPWMTILAVDLEAVWREGIGWLPGNGPIE
jgi:hypothetical protein